MSVPVDDIIVAEFGEKCKVITKHKSIYGFGGGSTSIEWHLDHLPYEATGIVKFNKNYFVKMHGDDPRTGSIARIYGMDKWRTFYLTWDDEHKLFEVRYSSRLEFLPNYTGKPVWVWNVSSKDKTEIPAHRDTFGDEMNIGDIVLANVGAHKRFKKMEIGSVVRWTSTSMWIKPLDSSSENISTKNGECVVKDPDNSVLLPEEAIEPMKRKIVKAKLRKGKI